MDSRDRPSAAEAPEKTGSDAAAPAPEPTLAPPGSLMSVRVRRRTLMPDRRPGASAPAPRPAPVPESAGAAASPPGPAPARRTEPVRPAAAPPPPAQAESIATYWSRLRAGRRFPMAVELDPSRIAADWPTSILMRCRAGSRTLVAEKVFYGQRDGEPRVRAPSGVDFSPLMLQWLLGLAAEAVRDGRPMEDVEAFPTLSRSVRYRALALPFSDDQRSVDHVLCYVCPSA